MHRIEWSRCDPSPAFGRRGVLNFSPPISLHACFLWREKVMRYLTAVVMILGASVLLNFSACADTPQRPEYKPDRAIGAFCQTATQLKAFVRIASEVNIGAAIRATSDPERNCAIAPLAYYEHGPMASIIQDGKSYRLFRATVVAVMEDQMWITTSPNEAFIAILEKGEVA